MPVLLRYPCQPVLLPLLQIDFLALILELLVTVPLELAVLHGLVLCLAFERHQQVRLPAALGERLDFLDTLLLLGSVPHDLGDQHFLLNFSQTPVIRVSFKVRLQQIITLCNCRAKATNDFQYLAHEDPCMDLYFYLLQMTYLEVYRTIKKVITVLNSNVIEFCL